MTLSRTSYRGWRDCYRLDNGLIEAIGTAEVGPRILHLGATGGRNLFAEIEDDAGLRGGSDWRLYGGHRLWHAPEDAWRSYRPDNDPVEVGEANGWVTIEQPVEPETGIVKRIELALSPDAPHLRLVHRLRNRGAWPIELAPWALSVMATGGAAFAPLPPRGTHPEQLAPSSTLTLWPYTDMADPRWSWGRSHVALRQQPGNAVPQKVGLDVPDGWAGYLLEGTLFLKLFEHRSHLPYPDLGSSVELFTNDVMLELETLGPLQTLAPGDEAVHVEDWFVFSDPALSDPAPNDDPSATFDRLLPHVGRARRLRDAFTDPDAGS